MLHPKSIAHHRNGVCGVPFHVCLFKDGKDLMLGIKFNNDNTRDIYTAVFNVAKLAAGDIEFASNSYRGDMFDGAIKGWIKAYNDEWDRKATEGAANAIIENTEVAEECEPEKKCMTVSSYDGPATSDCCSIENAGYAPTGKGY